MGENPSVLNSRYFYPLVQLGVSPSDSYVPKVCRLNSRALKLHTLRH